MVALDLASKVRFGVEVQGVNAVEEKVGYHQNEWQRQIQLRNQKYYVLGA